MNVLLVKPRPDSRSINLQSFMISEPLELEYAAAALERAGHSADIVDMVLEKRSLEEILRRGKNGKFGGRNGQPDSGKRYNLVAFTSYINHVGVIKEYARIVKAFDPSIRTAVGGVHCEVVPEDFRDENIDAVLYKRGLERLVELADDSKRMGEDGIPERTAESLSPPAFSMPHPARNKTAEYRSRYNYIYHDRCATIKTSTGCPYRCEFCFCARIAPYSRRELGDVLDELEEIQEKNVFIVDDDFLFDRERLTSFCAGLDERGIEKNFIAFGRADFIDENEDIVRMLAAHGFEAFFVGLESFKESELGDFDKRTTVEVNVRAVRILERAGVQCYSGLIVGMDWTKRDFDELIRYLNGFEHPMVNIQPITPMPGTPTFDRMKDEIAVPRERYELWDMAHLVTRPKGMGARRFYFHILRAYWKTSASRRGRKYIREKYGVRVYRRVRRGAFRIAMQYVKLALFPGRDLRKKGER